MRLCFMCLFQGPVCAQGREIYSGKRRIQRRAWAFLFYVHIHIYTHAAMHTNKHRNANGRPLWCCYFLNFLFVLTTKSTLLCVFATSYSLLPQMVMWIIYLFVYSLRSDGCIGISLLSCSSSISIGTFPHKRRVCVQAHKAHMHVVFLCPFVRLSVP